MIEAPDEMTAYPAPVQGVAPATKRHASVGESVIRGALANFSAQPLTWAASFLVAAFVPRLLGSDALGQVTIAVTITAMASTVLNLGVPDFLTRRAAQRPATVQHDIGVGLYVLITTALLGALAIGFCGPLLAPSLLDYRILHISLVGMVFTPAQGLLLSALRGKEQHGRYAWFNATGVIGVALVSVLVLVAGGDVIAYAASGTALSLVSMLLNWKLSGLRISLPPLDRALLRQGYEFARGGFPFLSWNVTLSVYGGIDRLLLGAMVPASEVGWYAAAYRIVGIAVFIPTMLTTPLFPALSRNADKPDILRRAIAQTLRVALLFTVPVSAGIIVVAPMVPRILGWPADFGNAVPLMMILSLHLPVVAIDMVLGTVIMSVGREGRWVRVGLVAAAFNVTLNMLGIPMAERLYGDGAIGAAVTTVLTELLMFCGAVLLIPKHLLDVRLGWQAARVCVAGAATCLVGLLLLPFAVAAAVLGGAFAYIVVAVVLRVLTPQDIAYVRDRLSRKH